MKIVESTIRFAIPTLGIGRRWFKEELEACGIRVPLADACVRELAMDALQAARRQAHNARSPKTYLSCLRQQIRMRAEFLRIWTMSDDIVELNDPSSEYLVSLARRYALPRPWRLLEPVVSECPRRTPAYGYGANAM
jgi:hypothetical protein